MSVSLISLAGALGGVGGDLAGAAEGEAGSALGSLLSGAGGGSDPELSYDSQSLGSLGGLSLSIPPIQKQTTPQNPDSNTFGNVLSPPTGDGAEGG